MSSNSIRILEDAVRDLFARVVWSHKIQEKQADIYQEQYKTMETINIVCASLTSVGIISTMFNDSLWIKIVSALLSFVTVFVATYFKSFEPSKQAKSHKEAANNLLIARNEITCLITAIKMGSKPISELEDRYNELMRTTNQIYKEAPQTSDKAVKRAEIALKVSGDNTFSDCDIDLYLPAELRKGGN